MSCFLLLSRLLSWFPHSPGYFIWFPHCLQATFSGFLTHFPQIFSGFFALSRELSLVSTLSLSYFFWFPHSFQASFSGFLTLSRLLFLVSSLSLSYFLWFPHSFQATFSGFLTLSRLLSLVLHYLYSTFSGCITLSRLLSLVSSLSLFTYKCVSRIHFSFFPMQVDLKQDSLILLSYLAKLYLPSKLLTSTVIPKS